MAETNLGSPLRVGSAIGLGTASAYGSRGALTSPIYVYNIVPATLSTTAVAAAQAVAGAGNLTINGASAASGVATFDVARAVQIVSSSAGDTTQTATVYGTDYWGYPLTELIAFNGTTPVFGKKAFLKVTRVAISAALAGNGSAGNSDIFGLPYAAVSRNYVLTAYNGVQVTTGTWADAVTTSPATTTTGDTRGTFLPASAADGSKKLTIWIFLTDPDTSTTLYGVTQV